MRPRRRAWRPKRVLDSAIARAGHAEARSRGAPRSESGWRAGARSREAPRSSLELLLAQRHDARRPMDDRIAKTGRLRQRVFAEETGGHQLGAVESGVFRSPG